MDTQTVAPSPVAAPPPRSGKEVPFGVNELRLNARQWLWALAVVVLVALATPWLWERFERFDTGPDYRIPYSLSKDYWLYGCRLRQVASPEKILLVGDSVVWGEYVLPDGTLSHFLNQQAGVTDRFVNVGLNGLFPLAEEGLMKFYGQSVRHQKVIVHCNLLWLTSPKADLRIDKEEQFNHSRLVPQFHPRLACYRADANERLSAIIERHVSFIAWVGHLQNAYFDQKSILSWTLADDGGSPPYYPNAWKDPLTQITLRVPPPATPDPERGPASPRHKPWSAAGQGTTHFDWVSLDASLQWRAFQRLVRLLQDRGNDVMVILGPFNEHMLAEENRPAYRQLRDGVAAWLKARQIPSVLPETLPSALYADASHPLTEGYKLLSQRLYEDPSFRAWAKP